MKNYLNLSAEAIRSINAIQHPCGTYGYYHRTLRRVFNHILHHSDEMGMSSNEAVATLRALDNIDEDITAISGRTVHDCSEVDFDEFDLDEFDDEDSDDDENDTDDTGAENADSQ